MGKNTMSQLLGNVRTSMLLGTLLFSCMNIAARPRTQEKACEDSGRKVLYCEGQDGDEKLASAMQNQKIAMDMLKQAIADGHVVQDKKGMYVRKCDKNCNCLPIMPSAVKSRQ